MANIKTSLEQTCQQQLRLGSDLKSACHSLTVTIRGPEQLRDFLQEEVAEELQKQRQDIQQAFRAGIAHVQWLIDQKKHSEAGMYLEEVLHWVYFPRGYDGSLHVLASYFFKPEALKFTGLEFIEKVKAVGRYCGFDTQDKTKCFDISSNLENKLQEVKSTPWLVPVWENDVNTYGQRWRFAPNFALPKPTNDQYQGKSLCAFVQTGQCVPTGPCEQPFTEEACKAQAQSGCGWKKEGE